MKAVITSVSSGIGAALADKWLDQGWDVAGTYRTLSDGMDELMQRGLRSFELDFSSPHFVDAVNDFKRSIQNWDVLVMCPASMNPIGLFEQIEFNEWSDSVEFNFLSNMRFIHALIPIRDVSRGKQPAVITWAGGGVNSAPVRYSAYIVSKIAQLKMMELLDAEIDDTKFVTIGPGWVDTKIHQETLKAGEAAGSNYKKTNTVIRSGDWTPMKAVLECCDWVLEQPKEVVSGRNFSVANREWRDEKLSGKLRGDEDLFKLRRYGNGD